MLVRCPGRSNWHKRSTPCVTCISFGCTSKLHLSLLADGSDSAVTCCKRHAAHEYHCILAVVSDNNHYASNSVACLDTYQNQLSLTAAMTVRKQANHAAATTAWMQLDIMIQGSVCRILHPRRSWTTRSTVTAKVTTPTLGRQNLRNDMSSLNNDRAQCRLAHN